MNSQLSVCNRCVIHARIAPKKYGNMCCAIVSGYKLRGRYAIVFNNKVDRASVVIELDDPKKIYIKIIFQRPDIGTTRVYRYFLDRPG